ncbi:hypothetical protein BC941DRAFT_410957 [Chlamydoabsidia padenii]|nr:hypothetical protein BC941DRAFT_410957 [Chlamydoabsidia padenii]
MQYNICHAWIYVAELLMFPSNLMDLVKQKETVFKVFGGSALAEMVRSAIKVSHPKNNLVSSLLSPISPALKSTNSSSSSSPSLTVVPTRTVLLFDRSDGFLYQKSLQQERFSDDVSIFEFGCPTLADPIAPALEVYPKDTGGYITTDINNMLKDPDILDRMVELMKKSNATRPGTWQIILHTDFLSQIMRSGTGTIAQNVISKLLIYMDRDEIHVLENWMEVPEQSNWRRATLDWFNVVAQSHMHKHQAFYFVDDSLNLTSFQYRYPLIHFIQSKH